MDFKAMMRAERELARRKEAAPPPPPPATNGADGAVAAATAAALCAAQSGSGYSLPLSDARPRFSPAEHVITTAPPTVCHIANFISSDEEAEMLRQVELAPPTAWTPLRGRRLQSLGGLPQTTGGMVPLPLPRWVQSVCDALVRCGVFDADAPPNHVLLNEYAPGQGIDAHKDGPLYLPKVAILSLGSAVGFEFVRDDTGRAPLAQLLLPPRGLLVFEGEAYEDHLHRVPAVAQDVSVPDVVRLDLPSSCSSTAATDPPPPDPPPRTRRVSLTVRRVLHVREDEPVAPPPPLWEERATLAKWLG